MMHRVKAFVDPESLTFVAKFFIVFAVSYTFAVSVAFHFVVDEWKIYAKNSIAAIERSDQASVMGVCEIMSCTYIEIDDTIIYRDGNNEFTETKPDSSGFESMFDTIVAIPIENKSKEVVFGLSITPLIKFYLHTVLILYVFLMVLSLVFLIRYLISSNIKSLVNGASNTASLHNKN
ncbi:MAG TPA: hypothetical protein EYP39_08095, partial [Ghiorsea sp.]|nr:hypothetical protein [Ghiorsea sp.]